MLTSNEKRLLYVLALILIICGIGLFVYFRVAYLITLENDIKNIELNIRQIKTNLPDESQLLKQIEETKSTIETEKNKFYKPGEIKLSDFGIIVKDLIQKSGLIQKGYKTVDTKQNTYLELQVQGDAFSLSKFLYSISNAKKYWSIKEINIKNTKGDGKSLELTLRISYETYDANVK